MNKMKSNSDCYKTILSLLFVFLMIATCLWILKPFLVGFTWASIIVIATWPFMLKTQRVLYGSRSLAVITMVFVLVLIFIIPLVLLINSLVENSGIIIDWIRNKNIQFPELSYLQNYPLIGKKLYVIYHYLINGSSAILINQIQPYIGRTTKFFFTQASHIGQFIIDLGMMLLFSIPLYWRGEEVSHRIHHLIVRLSYRRGDKAVVFIVQAIRSVALGVVVTALVQGILGGIGLSISGIPFSSMLTIFMILSCLVQLGPLIILVPAVIWLYWINNTTEGTILLIWSCLVGVIDHILRPFLIRKGADLPVTLIFFGVIGGLLAFGIIGLFIGPVVLAISYRVTCSWIEETPSPPNYR
ncbi:Putative transport protein YdiK [Candidatus Erwinia haradaeae]|uniref:Transport protein YdiK, partial n=1 Tax=Candidatus Erwinia haradaeae TaxID=1922217 RepID=A0A451CZE7_9GAMM|nr:AI-2E family transporter YdiK [Candidatus Erwinia haradaeae]VFP78774.1 Putative transport protein YdiK [Candidatus Erwinia haradaeae]